MSWVFYYSLVNVFCLRETAADIISKKAQTTTLPERIPEINVDAEVTLPPVCTVHFNLEMTKVSSTCCKSTNGKNL